MLGRFGVGSEGQRVYWIRYTITAYMYVQLEIDIHVNAHVHVHVCAVSFDVEI